MAGADQDSGANETLISVSAILLREATSICRGLRVHGDAPIGVDAAGADAQRVGGSADVQHTSRSLLHVLMRFKKFARAELRKASSGCSRALLPSVILGSTAMISRRGLLAGFSAAIV